MVLNRNPPNNCFTCDIYKDTVDKCVYAPLKIVTDQGTVEGVAYGGNSYHIYDFVLYRSEEKGPAHIGYITNITFPVRETATSSPKIYLQCVGRVNTIMKTNPAVLNGLIKDEVRHISLHNE